MRPIMLAGTGSDVGKSWIATGICRWLKNKGYHPAPFKAQNMSLNSFSTPTGAEIGRAQAVQAEACGIACRVEMNPILLKPTGESKSQIVLNGKPIGDQTAKAYFLDSNRKQLFEEAIKSFNKLANLHRPVVMEGAGSISELNLKSRDIANMRMAHAANACVYLVADIDRGGVFGSVYGTIILLAPWERKLMKGIIINKFRGDVSLFEKGRIQLEALTGVPILGILPFAKDICIEEEDSVALSQRSATLVPGKLNVAVVQLHCMANYTDFQPLEQCEAIHVCYTRDHSKLKAADIVILPGSKNTLSDLESLKKEGLATLLQGLYGKKMILGICGGYQMMGKALHDPYGVESNLKTVKGLGFFDIETTLTREKQTVQQSFQFKSQKEACIGYEIHMGQTQVPVGKHLNLVNGRPEGYFDGDKSWGTYLHGIFDNAVVVKELLGNRFADIVVPDYRKCKEENYEKLAAHISRHINMDKIMEDILEVS